VKPPQFLLRSPTLHFLLLGGLVFAGQRLLLPDGAQSSSAAAAAVEQPSTEELLLRDAIALGLDRSDPLVRHRLARLGESVVTDGDTDGASLEREARRLGLDRSDPVVRRRLVHAMELALSRVDQSEWPDDAELRSYYERHRDRYMQPAVLQFTHVYFARDRDGIPAETAASGVLAELESLHIGPVQAAERGDPFMLGHRLTMTGPELARRFGEAFAGQLENAPVDRWLGPLQSPFGRHVVRVERRTSASAPQLDAVRGRVVHDLLAERAAERFEERLRERRELVGR